MQMFYTLGQLLLETTDNSWNTTAGEPTLLETLIILVASAGACLFFAAIFALFIFNVIMIFDALKREFPDKQTWLGLLIIGWILGFGPIVAIIYYFSIRTELVKAEKSGVVSPTVVS